MVIAAILETQHVLWSCRGEHNENKQNIKRNLKTKMAATYQQTQNAFAVEITSLPVCAIGLKLL